MTDTTLPTLTVTGGPHDGKSLVVDAVAVRYLGATDACALQVPAANVSPLHARLMWDPATGLYISDASSATGTYVNGERIESDQPLQDGDRVCLGPPGSKETVKFVVRIPTAGAEPMVEAEPAIILDGDEGFSLDASAAGAEPAIIMDEAAAPKTAPATPAPRAPAAPAPAPPAAPEVAEAAAAAKKAPRPEYTTDIPSFPPVDRPREAVPLPVAAPPAKKPAARRAVPPIRRAALVAAAAAVLAGLAFAGYRFLHTPPPVLTSVLPPLVEGGQTVTVKGTGFGSDAAALSVRVGNQPGKVLSASGTEAAVTVPGIEPASGSADFPLTIESRAGRSNPLFVKITALPRLASLRPDVAMPGDEIVGTGKHLGGKPLSILVGGIPTEPIEAGAESVRFRVPDMPVTPGVAVPVVAQVGRESGRPTNLLLGRLPLLTTVSPNRGMAGERVALKGRGFDRSPGGNLVRFGRQVALVFSASESEIAVAAPSAFESSSQVDTDVVVETRGRRSNPQSFVLTRLSSGFFMPRYFPAPAGDVPGPDRVLVATDLGPALLLGGKGDAASTAERAARVAAALNGLVDAASRQQPVRIELRDKPALGVVAAGSGALIVSVTPEDVAAYETWDPAARRRLSARGIAGFWAALLEDHLALFVRHERPIRVMELSPRGQALLQIYSEAVRRSGSGAGVPVGVVSPLPPALARDLRDMALLPPVEGQSVAAAAVTGRWEGTMAEEGAAEKRIVVRLRLQGSKLAGTLTTGAGAVAVDVPLQDIAYERATLRFVLAVGGAPRRFSGAVQGESVAGTIRIGDKDVGRFTLKYVE